MKEVTWTLKVEWMDGTVGTVKAKALTVGGAIEAANRERRIGNVLSVHQGKTRYI